MNDILLIENNVEFSGKHKGVFERSFSKKDLGEAAYILSIKIYSDRPRCLISFFNEYIPGQDFEVVQNGTVIERVLACVTRCEVVSKTQSPTTVEDRKRMKVIPYASAIGSIKYVMLCTRSIVYSALVWQGCTIVI